MTLPDWIVSTLVYSAVITACVLCWGVTLWVGAMCANGMWRWAGYGREIALFVMWRLKNPNVRLQYLLWDEWVTLEEYDRRRAATPSKEPQS